MASSNNVIQIDEYRKKKGKSNKISKNATHSTAVKPIGKIRKKMINEERRKVKRTLLTEFVGASVILPGVGLIKVNLSDISNSGLSFDCLQKYGQFKKGEEIAVRIYLNHTTYFPLLMTVTNIRFIKEIQSYRHGAEFIEGTVNDEAISYFIKFMESVSTSLKADKGDLLLTK